MNLNLILPLTLSAFCFLPLANSNNLELDDEAALRVILNSVSPGNKYFFKSPDLDSSESNYNQEYQRGRHEFRNIVLKYPQLNIVRTDEEYFPDKLVNYFPYVPFRIIRTTNKLNLELGALIDKITYDILTTPLGSKVCQAMTNGLKFQMMHIFDISATTAERLQKTACPVSDKFNSLPIRDQKILDYTVGERELFSNYEFLVFLEDVELPFESWTTTQGRGSFLDNNESTLGKTYIHIDPKRFKLLSLYRVIAHEIFMRIDYRSQVPPFEEAKNLVDQSAACIALSTALHPQIRLAMSTVRAFQWENRILKELGFITKEEADSFSSQSCATKVKQMIPYTVEFKSLLEEEAMLIKNALQRQCPITYEDLTFENIEKSFALTLKDSQGNETTWCEKLVSSFSIDRHVNNAIAFTKYFHPGPRPPIGRGTGSYKKEASSGTIMSLSETDSLQLEKFNVFKNLK